MAAHHTDTLLVLSFAAFCGLFLLCVGIWQFVRENSKRRKMIRKIKHYAHDSRTTFAYSNVSEIKSSKLYNLFSVWGSKVVTPGTHDYSHMRLRFLKAGIRYSKAAEICWGVKCFLALIIPVVFIMTRLALFKLTNNMATLVICVLGALAGYYLPDLWLRLKVQARKKKLLAALPDALDLMVVCVEAGMGLDGAFSRVAEEIHLNSPEMSEELKMMNLEMRAGKSRQNALQDLAVRSDLDEMNSLVTLLIQTDKFGTSMAASLRVFSDAYRTKRYQRAEELAAKIPVKLVFPLVLFIFPSLFAVILGPAAIRIWQNIISK